MAYTYPKLHVTQVDCSRKRHGGRKSTLQSTPVTNAAWLTNRVLEYGRWANWQILVSEYGKPRLADLATSLRTLSPKSLAFCSAWFALPQSAFRCSTSMPSRNP